MHRRDDNTFDETVYKLIATHLRINTNEKIIKISGNDLNIENINDDEIKISGKIFSITFE